MVFRTAKRIARSLASSSKGQPSILTSPQTGDSKHNVEKDATLIPTTSSPSRSISSSICFQDKSQPQSPSLPPEIWDMILSLLLVHPGGIRQCPCSASVFNPLPAPGGGKDQVNESNAAAKLSVMAKRNRHYHSSGWTLELPPLSIMLVSRALHERVHYIFYGKNNFHFDTVHHLTKTLQKMTLATRRALAAITVFWGTGYIGKPEQLRDCTSLKIVRMWLPHNYKTGPVASGEDLRNWKAFEVFDSMRGLKEITLSCPCAWLGWQRGLEPTSVRDAQCVTCNQLQRYLETMVYQQRP